MRLPPKKSGSNEEIKNHLARSNIGTLFHTKYLGVKLDRTLSYKEHCKGTKSKVMSRNNIIRKLTGTKWGANPNVLRSSALALCVSAGEYAAPAWKNSSHAKHVDIALNEAEKIVTGTMKPTPFHKIYPIVGITPPDIRRQVTAETERGKQISDRRLKEENKSVIHYTSMNHYTED